MHQNTTHYRPKHGENVLQEQGTDIPDSQDENHDPTGLHSGLHQPQCEQEVSDHTTL
jgi:hypothetical protein